MRFLILGAITIVVLTVAVVVTVRRDIRRFDRQMNAVEAAMSWQPPPPPAALELMLVPVSRPGALDWRWLLWNARRDFASGEVEGTLVPYGLGTEKSRAGAEAAAQRKARELWTPVPEITVTVRHRDDLVGEQ